MIPSVASSSKGIEAKGGSEPLPVPWPPLIAPESRQSARIHAFRFRQTSLWASRRSGVTHFAGINNAALSELA